MIDLNLLRNEPDVVRASQTARGENPHLVDEVLAADAARREAVLQFEQLRAEQKNLGKEIGPLQGKAKQGDAAASKALESLMKKATEISEQVAVLESAVREADEKLDAVIKLLSNIVEPDAPIGGEADFKVISEHGVKPTFDFEVKDHAEIGETLGAIDIERGAKEIGRAHV